MILIGRKWRICVFDQSESKRAVYLRCKWAFINRKIIAECGFNCDQLSNHYWWTNFICSSKMSLSIWSITRWTTCFECDAISRSLYSSSETATKRKSIDARSHFTSMTLLKVQRNNPVYIVHTLFLAPTLTTTYIIFCTETKNTVQNVKKTERESNGVHKNADLQTYN
jgi:hypothetical protein